MSAKKMRLLDAMAGAIAILTFAGPALADGVNPFSNLREGVYREDCAVKVDSLFIIAEHGKKIDGWNVSCVFKGAKGTKVTLSCIDEDGTGYSESYHVQAKGDATFSAWKEGSGPYVFKLCRGES